MERALAGKIWTILEPVVMQQGYEIVDVEVHGTRRAVLRVFLNSPQGISIDKCAEFARIFSDLLDVEDPIKVAYQLEVSSPGLNRPLRKPEHFKKAVGETVTLKAVQPDGRYKKMRGVLTEAHDDRFVVQEGKEQHTVALADVVTANVVYDFSKMNEVKED